MKDVLIHASTWLTFENIMGVTTNGERVSLRGDKNILKSLQIVCDQNTQLDSEVRCLTVDLPKAVKTYSLKVCVSWYMNATQ